MNSNMPAMPQPIAANENVFLDTNEYNKDNAGLTKREHFAGLAMQGLLANSALRLTNGEFIGRAVTCADALLAELDKVQQ